MAGEATSQWDFGGELFPVAATRRVYSVSELTAEIRRWLERHLGQLWISGEITNCRAQNSGHVYFTLKDAFAQISCVVFRNDPVAGRESLQDGRKVILKGELTVYEPRGQYKALARSRPRLKDLSKNSPPRASLPRSASEPCRHSRAASAW
jgi:exodeoxyribonuclease VII large subunit